MPLTGSGPDSTVVVEVTADASKAAAQIEQAFEEALRKAFSASSMKTGINEIVSSYAKGMAAVTKRQKEEWKTVMQSGTKAASTIGKAFEQVGKKSQEAFKFNEARGARGEIQALNAQVVGLVHTLDQTKLSAQQSTRMISDLTRAAATQARLATQESRTVQQGVDQATRLSIVATQQKIAADRDASNQAIQAARARARYIIEAERTIVRAISATWTAAGKAVSAFARASAATLRGFARTTESIFRGIGTAIQGIGKGFANVFKGLTSAAKSAVSGLSRVFSSGNSKDENAWKSSLRNRERALTTSLNSQSRAIQSFQAKSRSGLLGGLTSGGALAGVAGGAGIGALLTSGFQRAGEVELLNLTFNALLGNVDKAKAVLTDLSNYARTTPFDFTEIAQSVAQLTAALGDVDKATNLTKFLGDIVALTGGTTESLGRVRLALSQIAGAGRLDSANLRQITESLPGVPIAQILADKFFGGDVQAYSQARDAGELGGKISAEAFFTAFMEGANERFPELKGFAEVAGTTLTGLTQNLKENFAIFGATINTLVQGPIKAAIGGINTVLQLMGDFVSGKMFDTTGATTPWGSQLVEKLSPALQLLKDFRETLGHILVALGSLLALKGAWEVFGLLGSAVRLALTPMGLLVVAVAGVTAAIDILKRVSPAFNKSWKGFTDAIGGTITAIGKFARGLRTALTGAGGAGGESPIIKFIHRLGDALVPFNNVLRRVTLGVLYFFNAMGDMLTLRGFDHFASTLHLAIREGVRALFDISYAEATTIEQRGGNDILNLLETTFLGPVIRFFRGPFSNLVETVGGFIADQINKLQEFFTNIWRDIFGGGDQADAGPMQFLADQFEASGGDKRSIGTKILDTLESTFLGPVVRFFRGPFADVVESFGGFLADMFNALFRPAEGAAGIGTRVADVLENTFLGPVVRFLRGPLSNALSSIGGFFANLGTTIADKVGQIGTLLAPLGGAIEGFVSTWKDKGIGAAFSSLWDGITESAGNLWDGKDGNGGIKAGLQGAIDSITNWFSTTFTGKNATTWALSALAGLRLVGEKVGRFLASPEFLGTVIITAAAVAGAVAAILGAFTAGFAEGVKAELGRWGGIISDGLSNAWDSLSTGKLKFLPDPIIHAISAVLGSSAIGLGIGAGALALGGLIIGKVVSAISTAATTSAAGNKTSASITNVARNLVGSLFTGVRNALVGVKGKEGSGGLLGGFRSLGAMIFPKVSGTDSGADSAGRSLGGGVLAGLRNSFTQSRAGQALSGLKTHLTSAANRARTQYGSVGTAIATAIVAGIADYEINFQAGQSGGTGSKLLGLLFGVGTGAAYGASVGGAVGAVAGAAIGGAIAIIGQHFGEAAKKAQEFDDIVNSIRGSLQNLSQDQWATGLLDNISERLTANATDFADWGQQLANSGYDFGQFVQDILAGKATADSAFADYVSSLKDELLATGDVGPQVLQHFTDSLTLAAQSGDFSNVTDLLNEAFKGMSVDEITQITDAFDALPGHFTGIIDGTGDVNDVFTFLKGTIEGTTATAAQLASQSIITGDTMNAVFSKAIPVNNPEKYAADVSGEFENVKSKIDIAQEALDTFFGANTYAASAQAIQDRIIGQYADLPATIAAALEGTSNQEQVDAALRGVFGPAADAAKEALHKAISEGTVFDATSLADFNTTYVGPLIQAIRDSPLSPAVKESLIEGLQALNGPDARALVAQQVGAVASEMKKTMRDVLHDDPITGEDLLGGGGDLQGGGGGTSVGTKFGTSIIGSILKSVDKARPEVSGAFRKKLIEHGTDTDVAHTFASGLKVALIASAILAVQGGRAIGQGAANGVKSASVAFFAAGVNAGRAFSLGLLAQVAAAASAAATIARAAVNSAKTYLKVASPSKVFVDIGTQVGEGFIKGIKDSEGDMAQAMATALENAVTLGVKRAGVAVQRAQAAGQIFDMLQPSLLPGGTTDTSRLQSTLDLREKLAEFTTNQRSNAASAFGDLGNGDLTSAGGALLSMRLTFRQAVEAIQGQTAEAREASTNLHNYNAKLADLNAKFRSGALGWEEHSRQLTDLNEQLSQGSLTQAEFNKKLAELNTSVASGVLNQNEYNRLLGELGDRPAALTIAQQSLLATGSTSLTAGSIAGNANREAIVAAVGTIQDYGQALLESGQSVASVIKAVQGYRSSLILQAQQLGFNRAEVVKIVEAYGLSDVALAKLRASLTDLNPATQAGIANLQDILGRLTDIREFGVEMLNAGVATSTVVEQLRNFRNAFRTQAVGFGFSAAQIDKLIDQMGLSDSALANFVKQMRDFENAAKGAAAASEAAAKAAADKAAADAVTAGDTSALPVGRPIGELHVHVPYGDPSAVALATANRIAYESLSSWS